MSEWHRGNKKWLRVRKTILDENNWKCRVCGKYGNEVDHKKPICRGGEEYERSNLQVLCRGCHIRKTQKEWSRKRAPIPGAQSWDLFVATNLEKVKS